MTLDAGVIAIHKLTEAQIECMMRLMKEHYAGVRPSSFREDLAEKDCVILLTAAESVCGFSTQCLFKHRLRGRCVRVVFSGDTIIDRKHWGSPALAIAWGVMMLKILAQEPDRALYWLLTSKGYKTYRFLPVFFHEFYPSSGASTPPFEAELIEGLGKARFRERFDPQSGVLRAGKHAQRLRPGIADITEMRRGDEHVRFFEQMNPGHAQGDELVCVARFSEANLCPYILKRLKRSQACQA